MKHIATEVELRVAKHYNYRTNLIVPNVYWGLGLNHECDMLVVRGSGYAIEIEIKVDKYDLRNDKKKRKWYFTQYGRIIKQTFFAVPLELADEINNIPEGCGFITVDCNSSHYYDGCVDVVKTAKINRNAKKLDQYQILKLAKLGCMRIWSLKEHMLNKKIKGIRAK